MVVTKAGAVKTTTAGTAVPMHSIAGDAGRVEYRADKNKSPQRCELFVCVAKFLTVGGCMSQGKTAVRRIFPTALQSAQH
jgi:hypothetical protein